MTTGFQVGDLVCHSRRFLRSTSWYTNVPYDGKVVELLDHDLVMVHWCNQDEPSPNHKDHIILFREKHLEPW